MFQLNASNLAGPFCMRHLVYYAYPLAEKLSIYATVKVSSERCSTKGPTKMVGSAQRVTSTPTTITDYHWCSRFVLHVISKLTFCISSTVKREDKETPGYRLNMIELPQKINCLLWFHMVLILGQTFQATKGVASARRGKTTMEETQTSTKPIPVAQVQRSNWEPRRWESTKTTKTVWGSTMMWVRGCVGCVLFMLVD